MATVWKLYRNISWNKCLNRVYYSFSISVSRSSSVLFFWEMCYAPRMWPTTQQSYVRRTIPSICMAYLHRIHSKSIIKINRLPYAASCLLCIWYVRYCCACMYVAFVWCFRFLCLVAKLLLSANRIIWFGDWAAGNGVNYWATDKGMHTFCEFIFICLKSCRIIHFTQP